MEGTDKHLSRRGFLHLAGGAAAAGALGGREANARGEDAAAQGGVQQISQTSGPVYGTSFISPLVEVFGNVFVGQGVFVASNTVLRASPEQRVEIGDATNAQDNIVIQGPAVEEGEELSFTIPSVTVMPAGAVVTDEASLQAVLSGSVLAMPETGGMDPERAHDFLPHRHE